MHTTKFRNITTSLLLTLVALIAGLPAHAQRYSFHNLSVDDGLIQSQAMSLTQDKTGNLWVGTLGGLSRFDGKSFTNFNARNGLLTSQVNALATDSSGNIWIGSHKGLMKFNGRTFEQFTIQRQVEHVQSSTQQISIVNDTVWWRAAGDVYYVTQGKIKYMVTPGPEGKITAIMAEKAGLWVAKQDTLYHFQNERWDTFSFARSGNIKGPYITRLLRDKENGIWVGTSAGIYKLEGKNIVPYTLNGQSLLYITVRGMAQDRSGAIWLATNSGVVKLTGSSIIIYNKHNGLSDNPFYDVLLDAEGNIWLASDGQGVFRFSGTLFTGLDETMGLTSSQIMAIATNKRDSLFLGTYEAGLFVFKDGKIEPKAIPNTTAPAVTSLCYASDHTLWIGTRENGLFAYGRNVYKQFTAPQHNFPSNSIYRLYEDNEKRLWIGFMDGAILYEHDTFTTVQVKNAHILTFLSIGNDSVLIATEKNGLMLYNGGTVSNFNTSTMADSSAINCLVKVGNELWMGSTDNGVIRYNLLSHKQLVINKARGLRSDFIYNIIDDNDGNIWVGTGFGIHKITVDKDGVPAVAFYGKEQGVNGMESNINAVLKMNDGGIWFGTTNGAVHYQPHAAVVTSAPTSIVLQSVKLVGESTIDRSYYDSVDALYGIPYNLRLPYKKNDISFSFQAITLSGAEQVTYRYMLEALDMPGSPWSEWTSTNSVTYSALAPGKYIFHVQCMGSGEGAYPEMAYPFEIITPFYKTRWFNLVIVFACILAGILIQYLYNRRKLRRQKLRAKLRTEEQAKIRMRTAEDFHDEIGNKLTRINVLTNVLKSKVTPTPDVTRILGQIEENTSLLYGGTRDILWSLKPSNDNLYEIMQRIHDFGGELFSETEINFTVNGIEEKWRKHKLPMDMSRNLIMIFKEALNNILKYAKANNVTLDMTMRSRNVLQLVLRDDGIGFDIKTIKKGNGITNMHVRAERLNGRLYFDTRTGKGTIITLTFRVPKG